MYVVAKVVGRCDSSREYIEQQHSPAQLSLELRDPPEQAQRECDHGIEGGAAKHHDLIMKLAQPLSSVRSLQQNGSFLEEEYIFGKAFLLADPLVVNPLVVGVQALSDHPPAGVFAVLIIVPESIALEGGGVAGLCSFCVLRLRRLGFLWRWTFHLLSNRLAK